MRRSDVNCRAIAFYLPQFHPIPENDEWWGKGFTEWVNVARARPLFRGHYQPHIPADLGFYDLRVPEVRVAQAEMAAEYGIEGFCYWHYWFGGKRLLERPFNEVLASGEPRFPFCLAWANHSWTGIWDAKPGKVLIEQKRLGDSDTIAHFREVLPAFKDERYITVEDKPVFVVFRPREIPEPERFTDMWRQMAVESGLKGVYFIGITDEKWVPEEHGFDASLSGNMYTTALSSHPFWKLLDKVMNRSVRRIRNAVSPKPLVYQYASIVRRAFLLEPNIPTRYPVVVPNWDNTPRYGRRGYVFHNSSPELFRIYVRKALDRIADRDREHRLVFIKSWNEWAEGNHMEPDRRYGRGYLEVFRQEVASEPPAVPRG